MRALKWFGYVVLAIVGIAVVSLTWLINTQPDLSAFEKLYAPPAQGNVTVRFFGTSSMLFSDGETNIMIDGWFSRPSTVAVLLGKVEPDIAAIGNGLSRLGNPTVAALIALHSHLDHAMDVAEVAKRTQALLVGSKSTANIGRGGGLPDRQIRVVEDGGTLRFGNFVVTMIETRHFVFPDGIFGSFNEANSTIDAPVVPPVSASAYRQGTTYSVLIDHPDGTALIQSSPGFKENSLRGLDVDTVYFGVGFIASQSAGYQDVLWREVVGRTKPEGIYIIHWDSFSHPIADTGNRPAAPNRLWNDLFAMRSEAGINYALARAEGAGIRARLLPMWQEVDAFDVAPSAGERTQ